MNTQCPIFPILLITLRQTRVCWRLPVTSFCLSTLSVFPKKVTFYFYFEHRVFPKVLVLWLNSVGFFHREGKFSADLTHFTFSIPLKGIVHSIRWVGFCWFFFFLIVISNPFLTSLTCLRDFSWVKWPLVPTGQVTSLRVTTCHLSSFAHELRRSREAVSTWSVFQSLLHPTKSLVTPQLWYRQWHTTIFPSISGSTHHTVAIKNLVCIVFLTRCWFLLSQNVRKDRWWWLVVYWKVSYTFLYILIKNKINTKRSTTHNTERPAWE